MAGEDFFRTEWVDHPTGSEEGLLSMGRVLVKSPVAHMKMK